MQIDALLPDPFLFDEGHRVKSIDDWPKRREQMLEAIVNLEYGGIPPAVRAHGQLLYQVLSKRPYSARTAQYHVVLDHDSRLRFRLDLLMPAEGDGPWPVLISGDGCWRYMTPQVQEAVLDRQIALAVFSRVEIIRDVYHTQAERQGGLYDVFPDKTFGAVAAWAWGYHRCIDVLETLEQIDTSKIAITGHSRGGKAALLAGATDPRVALTNANNSGCCGAGSHRCFGKGSERLADIIKNLGYWFGPQLADYVERDHELPFDQHELMATVAPRALLTTEALGDLWANPQGTMQNHRAAREVYDFLNADDRIAIHYRQGEHAHKLEDFMTLLDFIDWQFNGRQPSVEFNLDPFASTANAFDWQAPV